MNFESTIRTLTELLSKEKPASFNSSWILLHAPRCYRFIQARVRSELGGIDWDRITAALDRKHQRLWSPKRLRRSEYRDATKTELILNVYRDKLYAFVAPLDTKDRSVTDLIAIALVRLAQADNISAKEEIVSLLRFTIEEWIDTCECLSCWKGRNDEVLKHLEGCIVRYRYTGSFLNYLFRTLEYAGRGIRPSHACPLDAPSLAGLYQ